MVVHNWEDVPSIWWVEARDALNIPQTQDNPLNKEMLIKLRWRNPAWEHVIHTTLNKK